MGKIFEKIHAKNSPEPQAENKKITSKQLQSKLVKTKGHEKILKATKYF